MAVLKAWTGAAWKEITDVFKVWTGAAFEVKPSYYWDGAAWVLIGVTPPDAEGVFEIAGTYSTLDTTLTSGTFNIAGTYTVA